jgi:hypothetical protein
LFTFRLPEEGYRPNERDLVALARKKRSSGTAGMESSMAAAKAALDERRHRAGCGAENRGG